MKRVLVTGGGTGIGRSIARSFARQGDHVTLSGRRRAPLQETADGFDMAIVPGDVSVEADVIDLMDEPFDVVVANAGVGVASKVQDMRLEDWNRVINVNLTGVFLTFRAALQGMQAGGRLIAIASTAGLQGGPQIAAYSASKHGVIGLVRSLAKEVAKSGITCNAVCPGFVDTEMAADAISNVMKKLDTSRDQAEAMIVSSNPMRRLIDPDEVTAAVMFLASEGASSINGHALTVSGGEL